MAWYREFDIHLKQGWNVIRMGEYFDDTLQDKVGTLTSVPPSANAVWVVTD